MKSPSLNLTKTVAAKHALSFIKIRSVTQLHFIDESNIAISAGRLYLYFLTKSNEKRIYYVALRVKSLNELYSYRRNEDICILHFCNRNRNLVIE